MIEHREAEAQGASGRVVGGNEANMARVIFFFLAMGRLRQDSVEGRG